MPYVIAFPDTMTEYDATDKAVTAIKMIQQAHPRTMAVYLLTKVFDQPVAPLVGGPAPKRVG